MKTIVTSLLLILSSLLPAQEPSLSYRYWHLRQRFLDQFIRVGDCHGCSLPVSRHHVGWNELVFGDEVPKFLGWYIAILATENHLLRANGQPTAANREELYWALKALERLDKYGEFLSCDIDKLAWDEQQKIYIQTNTDEKCEDFLDPQANLNGFFVRNDVPLHWEQYYPGNTVKAGWHIEDNFELRPSDMSQDMLFHVLLGLAFTSKYVPVTESFGGHSLRDYARTISKRLIDHYSFDWILNNPVTGRQTENLNKNGEHSYYTGASTAFSYLVATAAHVIQGNPLPAYPFFQSAYDLANPEQNVVSLANKLLWTQSGVETVMSISLSASVNASMMYLLMAISGVPRPTPIWGLTGVQNYLKGTNDLSINGHLFYGNIYRALHNNNNGVGFSNSELRAKLEMLGCQGPFYYCLPAQIQTAPDKWDEVCGLGVVGDAGWNSENKFLEDEPNPKHGSDFNGHYPGIDWMLAHNIYLLNSGDYSSFMEGIHSVISYEWPVVWQDINPLGDPEDFWSPVIAAGSNQAPRYVYSKKITSSETFRNTSFYEHVWNPATQSWDIQQSTYHGNGYYQAEEGIDLLPGFTAEVGTTFTAVIGPVSCDLAHLRLGETAAAGDKQPPLRYEVVNLHLDELYARTILRVAQKSEEARIFPNPCKESFSLTIDSDEEKQVQLRLVSLDGQLQRDYHQVYLNKGKNQPSFSVAGLAAGVYQLIVSDKKKDTVLRLVKL